MRTVAYQAIAWFRQARPRSRQECPCLRDPARCPACCGPPPSGTATTRRTSRASATLSFAELLDGARDRRAATSRSASSPATGSWSGRPNSIDWAVAALAVSYAGGALVPVNTRYTGHEVADIVDRTGARVSWSSPTASSAAPRSPSCEAASDLASRARGRRPRQPRLGAPARRRRRSPETVEARADAVSPDDVADILFTSGTTGRPQGRDERAPADDRRRPTPGASSAGSPPRTATSWSTRSSTPSATRSASSSAC